MRGLAPKLLAAIAALAAALTFALTAPALAAPTVNGIFKLETEIGTNNKIVAGPDGNVWFTLASASKDVGRITPAGVVTEYELPGIDEPIGIASGPEGRLWVTAIGKATSFLPADPKGTEQSFESALINAEANLVLGPDGNFWVASNEKVAKFSPADFIGTIKEVKVTGALNPKDIDVAGSLLVIADNSAEKRIVTFTTAAAHKDFTISGGSQGVAGAAGGQIGYSDPAASPEESGLITPPSPAQSFELLGDPFGVAYGSDQAFWIAQFAAGGLTRVAADGSRTFLGGLPKETARQIAAGPDETLWVTLPKAGEPRIARISGLEPPSPGSPPSNDNPPNGNPPNGNPPSSAPPNGAPPSSGQPTPPRSTETFLRKKPKKRVKTTGGRAAVKFTFGANAAGATFECALGRWAKANKQGWRFVGQTFHRCASPRKLRLAPGRYRFQVRGMANALPDRSPAAFVFKVVRVAR